MLPSLASGFCFGLLSPQPTPQIRARAIPSPIRADFPRVFCMGDLLILEGEAEKGAWRAHSCMDFRRSARRLLGSKGWSGAPFSEQARFIGQREDSLNPQALIAVVSESVRKAARSGIWSAGVKLALDGAGLIESPDVDEIVARMPAPVRAAPPAGGTCARESERNLA